MDTLVDKSTEQEQPYLVQLEVFQGPLDLLLHLIEKRELDITKVSLVAVTDQYLEYISHLEHISAENLADFLVVAAKLLLIKSRALLPGAPKEEVEEEEDLGEELARQLREYKRFKELAGHLRELEQEGLRAYVRIAPLPELEKTLEPSAVSLDDLIAAVRAAISAQPEPGAASEAVAPLTISIADKIADIERLVRRRGSFSFQRLLRRATSRAEIIVTFLALLELTKASKVRVEQKELFGEILVLLPQQASAEPVSPAAPQQ